MYRTSGLVGGRFVGRSDNRSPRREDYLRAIDEDVALVPESPPVELPDHRFTAAVGVADLAAMGPPLVFDIGSGLLDSAAPWLSGGPPPWLASEPAVRQSLAQGHPCDVFRRQTNGGSTG